MSKDSRAHVALVLPNLRGGGAERSLLGVAGGLIERGHRVDLVLFRSLIHYPTEVPGDARLFIVDNKPDKRTKDCASHVLANLIQLPVSPTWSDWLGIMGALKWDPLCLPDARLVKQTWAVAAYMRRERPDCVVPSLPRAKIATLLACGLLATPPPIVPTIRNVIQARRLGYRRMYQRLFGRASHFVCVSQGVADGLVEQLGIPRTKVSTIYNPIVTAALGAQAAQPANHPWMNDGGAPVILSAGRLAVQKDYSILIKAFARVSASRRCRLIILGEGGRRKALERLVEDLGLNDCVSLPGWVDNPFAFMSRAALFVLSSRHEGLPGVLVQALACGCPCVSTDCPAGPAEILQGGRLGPLVPVGDPVGLAEAMIEVLDQFPDRQTLREGAAHFSAERAVSAYERLIMSIIPTRRQGFSALEQA